MIHSFFNSPEPDDMSLPFPEEHDPTAEKNICSLRRHLFCLWTYIIQQDMWEEAADFIEEHRDEPTPFDLFPFETSCYPY